MLKWATCQLLLAGLAASWCVADELDTSIARGEKIYQQECLECHMDDGTGVPEVFPHLAGSATFAKSADRIIDSILAGNEGQLVLDGQNYTGLMLPVPLENAEILDLLRYIYASWYPQSKVKLDAKMIQLRRALAAEKKQEP